MSSGAAVNVPTNYKIKEADVNAKLQLYGIYSAFSNGKVPSNQQIDIALNSVLKNSALASPSKKLSKEGQELVADFRDVIEKAKVLLLTKNHGNVIQDFVWQTQQLSGGDAQTPNAPIDKDTAKQHGNQALEGLRTLGSLLISNGQFRKLLKDVVVLGRDIAGDAAQKAATKINPSEDELAQIDEAAPDDTWHENPDLSKDKLKQQWNDRKPFGKDDVKDAADKSANAAQNPDGSYSASDALNAGSSHLQSKSDVDPDTQDKADQAQGKASEYKDRSTAYLKDKVPQERRDQAIWRLKKMVAEVQGHQDYQQAIDTLLSLAEEYAGHGKNVAGQSAGTVKGAHSDDSLTTAEADLRTIIERFANYTSLDDLFDALNQIYADADKDPELKNWFKDMDTFVRRCLKEQGYILKDSSTEHFNKLYDHGEFLLRHRYRNHTDRILDELKFFGDQFDKDPQNKAFGDAMNKLFLDLGNDENGQPTFKPHLVKDLTEVILPAFFENIRYVPIPRIEYKDPMIDLVVENLVLEGDNLAPNVLEFGSDNYWRWGRKRIASKNKNKVMLAVSGVQCDLRDVSYYVKKKEGFPAVTDKGVMDVILGGQGLSFKVAMETADASDRHHFFKVDKVDVSVKNMNIILKQSNHKLLFKLFKPLLLKVMNPVIQKAVEKQIRDSVAQLDAFLYSIHQEAVRAKEQIKDDPEQAQNFYQRYTQAFSDKMAQGKKKKDDVTSDKQVNMAVTQHDSIFPNIKLPGGISTKATEYKELAAKGNKWESPIFTIGSAKESTGLPTPKEVSRKPHNVTQGGVKDKSEVDGTGSSSNYSSAVAYGAGAGAATGAYAAGTDSSRTGYTGTTSTGVGAGSTSVPSYTIGGTSGTQGYPTGTSGTQGYSTGAEGYSTGTSGSHSYPAGYTGSQVPSQGSAGLASVQGLPTSGSTNQGFSSEVDQAFGEKPLILTNGNAHAPSTL